MVVQSEENRWKVFQDPCICYFVQFLLLPTKSVQKIVTEVVFLYAKKNNLLHPLADLCYHLQFVWIFII